MPIKQIRHVAYRCKDAKETVEWYRKYLDMDFIFAFAEDHVPSVGEFDPYMPVFLDIGNGNILAFFELPRQPSIGYDPCPLSWGQPIAFEVTDRDMLTQWDETRRAPKHASWLHNAKARDSWPYDLPHY